MPKLLPPLSTPEAFALLEDVLSAEDWEALRASPEGESLAQAAVGALCKLSTSLDAAITAHHLVRRRSDVAEPASGARAAEVDHELSYAGPTTIVVPAQSSAAELVTAEGHRFQLLDAVSLGPAQPSATVRARAIVATASATIGEGRLQALAPLGEGSEGDRCLLRGQRLVRRGFGDPFDPSWVGLHVHVLLTSGTRYLFRIAGVLSRNEAVVTLVDRTVPLLAQEHVCSWRLVGWAELGVRVRQPAPSTPGRDDELDLRAREAGRPRATGEDDQALRRTLLRLHQQVTPEAVASAAAAAAGDHGPVWVYEARATRADLDPESSLRPWPGFIVSKTPLGVAWSREGLALLAPSHRMVALAWAARGLGERRSFLWDSGKPKPKTLVWTRAMVLGRGHLGGAVAPGDGRLCRAVQKAVAAVLAAGTTVRWRSMHPHRVSA